MAQFCDKVMNPTKEYLGDSVYAEFDSFGSLVLTTENGLGPSNEIVLETQVLRALNDYVQRMTRKTTKADNEIVAALLKLIDDGDLVRNTERDGDVMAFMQQGVRISNAIKAAQDAIEKAK